MEILEINLKHYGKFENHRLTLKPGINIIYGKNETGKTTIHSFIRAMFFGLQRGRGRSARLDEYRLRQPWENPAWFAGTMRIREGREIYRIDRNFDREHQSLTVVCETRGQELEDGETAIVGLMNGMSESAFQNTVFVRQARGETEDVLMEELRGFMINYDSALDMQTDVSGALQSLRRKKKQFEQKKKEEEALLEEQISRRQTEADYLRKEMETLRERERMIRSQTENSREMEEPEEEAFIPDRRYKILMQVLLVIAALLAFTGAGVLSVLSARIFLGVFGVIFLAALILVHFLLKDGDGGEHETDTEDGSGGEQQWRLQNVREEISDREEKYQRLQQELEILYQKHVKLEGIEIEIEAVNLAMERITGLSSSIFEESGGSLNERASDVLSQITGGKYTRLALDDSSSVRIQSGDRLLHLYEVSYGTMQQVYFALRIAAGELLAQDHFLPLILDEPFSMYDDKRLEAVLTWLYRSGRQVILFTCQNRERRILEKIKEKEDGKYE